MQKIQIKDAAMKLGTITFMSEWATMRKLEHGNPKHSLDDNFKLLFVGKKIRKSSQGT